MRKPEYDKLVNEAIERINKLPAEKVTPEAKAIKDALVIVLGEKDETKLEGYYKRIDEFYGVNQHGLEYMSGAYLLNGVI